MHNNKIPAHIGIIPDGNRRFAKRLMLQPWKGHEWGAKKAEALLNWCKEKGVKRVTFYAFSVENFNRPKEEFDYLMNIFSNEFDRLMKDEKIHRERMKINFIGRLHMFPKNIVDKMEKLMEITKDYDNYEINFAMGYGGRTEILDAVKNVAKLVKEGKLKVDDINEEVFEKNLYISDEPDLIIRTGGESRTSNFLMWQSSYSEWIFVDKMWPEFEKEDFEKALEDYASRERKFGR
jgi:tritrans,polycis-undecaprenyl-diphosphate synthase [geranylgeranyl-diphosphate specific]